MCTHFVLKTTETEKGPVGLLGTEASLAPICCRKQTPASGPSLSSKGQKRIVANPAINEIQPKKGRDS